MSEIIDGYTANKIKDFWMNPGSSSYSHHSLCKEYTQHLEKEVDKWKSLAGEFRRFANHTDECSDHPGDNCFCGYEILLTKARKAGL